MRTRKPAPEIPLKSSEQRTFAAWMSTKKLVWCHIPQVKANLAGVQAKSYGAKDGMPDAVIFSRVPNDPSARGVAIEIKRQDGGATSVEKGVWMQDLAKAGWLTHSAKGAQDAINWLTTLGF